MEIVRQRTALGGGLTDVQENSKITLISKNLPRGAFWLAIL